MHACARPKPRRTKEKDKEGEIAMEYSWQHDKEIGQAALCGEASRRTAAFLSPADEEQTTVVVFGVAISMILIIMR